MKTKLLLILVFFSVTFINAQDNKELADKYLDKRGELVFTFTANTIDEIQQLARIISFDRGQDRENPLKISAVANKKNFKQFLAYNLPFEVNVEANEPKDVIMFDPKIHKKGVSGKNAAYPLSFPLSTYPTYQQYADQMAAFAADHPAIAELVDIGGTVQGDKRLLFIKLSDNVLTREAEPRVMYTSSMHGDETAGYPGMLNLIDYFITAYEDTGHADHTRIKDLLDNSEVWINPLANPDATFWLSSDNTSVASSRRENANNVDLNRNYPDNVAGAHPDGEVYQTETLAFMQFAEDYHFVLSANFHGGIELVNYPFDNAYATNAITHLPEDPDNNGPFYTHPDTDWFEYISVEYATQAQNDSHASYMTTDEDSYIYPSPGVTHGAEWYRVYGGRQDYINFYHQCREITLEISNVKTSPSTNDAFIDDEVIDIWYYNQEAYIKFLIQGTYGFRGIVKDATTLTPINAKITIVGRDDQTPITNSWVETELFPGTELGDFYRPIEAGTYDILIEADCYESITLTNQTIANYQTIVLADVLLTPANPVPSNLSVSSITTTSATLNWDDVGVTSYDIQYRVDGTSTWTSTSTATNSLGLTGLSIGTTYEFQIRSVCNATTSSFSASTLFTTLSASYCTSEGTNVTQEYISNVQLETINNTSGGVGYSDFTAISTDLLTGSNFTITISKFGNKGDAFAVWIDYNKDGDFLDAGELVTSSTSVLTGSFTVPLTASFGSTRMRVSLQRSTIPTSCETFTRGEVEDYTINIIDSTLGIQDEILSTFNLYPNPVKNGELKLQIPREITDFKITISNVFSQKVYENSVNSNYNNLHTVNTSSIKSGLYFVTVSTNLGKATKKIIIE